MSILTETMVANKALQRVGADEIGLGGGSDTLWTEVSRNAKEVRKTYDITRRFELRRNQWRFSIRTQVLRAIDDDTKTIVFPAWDNETDYVLNDVVQASDGTLWMAKQAMDAPSTDPLDHDFSKWGNYFGSMVSHAYDSDTSYMAGEIVVSSTVVYISLQNNNEDNTPVSSASYWSPLTDADVEDFAFIYPIGAGPESDTQTRNVYRLPYGFLREAPQSPKQGSYTSMGSPTNSPYTDWQFESNYFTSVSIGPIAFRFTADIEDPDEWDPMFVQGFSCAIALEICEPLTQSTTKLGAIGNAYLKFMSEARLVNGIETGPVEPPLDDYLACRY